MEQNQLLFVTRVHVSNWNALARAKKKKKKNKRHLKLNETFNNDHSLLQAEDKVARVTKNKQKLREQTGIVAIRLYLLHL